MLGVQPESDPLKTPSDLTNPVVSAAEATAKNTEKLVKLQEQELAKIALGGGNLARMGVVPAELRRSNRSGSAQGIGRLIESAIQEAATDQIADLVRRGHLKLAH